MVSPLSMRAAPTLEDKLAFLANGQSYVPPCRLVESIETHRAWVFLTDQHAWKLKKPVKAPSLDFSTIEARCHDCREEVRLNRRLATGVYLNVVPLVVERGGNLHFGGPGTVVDWLVQMKRLAADLFLDRMAQSGKADLPRVQPAADLLAAFYARSPPADISPDDNRSHLMETVLDNRAELLRLCAKERQRQIISLTDSQLRFLSVSASLFDARLKAGRVIEAHGDLRPDHIWLGHPPVVIDCLEFNRRLRTLDIASELTFLALECERLGVHRVGHVFVETYLDATDDAPTPELQQFYRVLHACTRAKLALWHLDDGRGVASDWHLKAAQYLDLACQ